MRIAMQRRQLVWLSPFLLLKWTEGLSQHPPLLLPTRADALIRQASSAVTRAFLQDGIHRQSIRLPLSESMYGGKEEGFVADRAIGWQGGPQETLRFLLPLASHLLRRVRTAEQDGGLPPRVTDQPLLDFDGSALLTAESPAGPRGDAQAMLQPNTDGYYLRTIRAIEEQFSDTPNKRKRLFLLVNPAWRDRSSWGFFGGKEAQELILDRYPTTFALDQFVVRGRKISLLKVWSYDWCVFLAPMDFSGDAAELVGSFAERPEYDKIDALIEECIRKKKEQ